MKRVHPCWDVFILGWNEISELETPVTERHLSKSPYFYFVLSPAVTVVRSLAHTHTHTLVLLHSKCVSHGVTQLVGCPPFLLRLPFSSPLSIFGQKDFEGQQGCERKAKQWFLGLLCATVVVQSSRQRRPGWYPSFLRVFWSNFLNNGGNYWRIILQKAFSWPTGKSSYIRWVIWNVAELDFT